MVHDYFGNTIKIDGIFVQLVTLFPYLIYKRKVNL